jgi:hypothetical protein
LALLQVRVSDPLAILYNDRSPMENHHLASAFALLNSEDHNFMRRIPHKVRLSPARKLIRLSTCHMSCILADIHDNSN